MPFQVLMDKLEEAVRSGPRVVGEYLDSEREIHLFKENDEGGVDHSSDVDDV